MNENVSVDERLESLREQIREVRASILDLLVRIDDLRLQQIPRALADWQLKIGCWEKALLEAELSARRAKRRLALMQQQVNRGEDIDEDAIEEQLEEELAEWQQKVEKARLAYERAMVRITAFAPMSSVDAKELKSLYRTLMKRLHPDVCHDAGARTELYFKIAQKAYEKGDIEALRSLEAATRYLDAEDDLDVVDEAIELEAELELLHIQESAVQAQLKELEESEPLRMLELLNDPEWVTERTRELRAAVQRWEDLEKQCRAREKELRRDINDR